MWPFCFHGGDIWHSIFIFSLACTYQICPLALATCFGLSVQHFGLSCQTALRVIVGFSSQITFVVSMLFAGSQLP